MTHIKMKYNPYTLVTELELPGKDVRRTKFSAHLNHLLQSWLDENDTWKGLPAELAEAYPSAERIQLDFCGTKYDFADVADTIDNYNKAHENDINPCFIELNHVNKADVKKIDPAKKLDEIMQLHDKIIDKGFKDALLPDETESAFQSALDDKFKITVIAPMSSGKSTLLNAIIGQELLMTRARAATAAITRIVDDDTATHFTVSAKAYNGDDFQEQEATSELLMELNEKKREGDEQRAYYSEIMLKGNVKGLSSTQLHTLFVDTPGGNNAFVEEHWELMEQAIKDEKKNLILFVFETPIETNDSTRILGTTMDLISKSMKDGKQARDRFLFVINKMDDLKLEKDPIESILEAAEESLHKYQIENPNLFPVAAQPALWIRMKNGGLELSESNEDDYDSTIRKMSRNTRKLYEYSTLRPAQKQVFRDQSEGKELGDPALAEINTGIPALEMAVTEYLEKYALAMKIEQAQRILSVAIQNNDIVHQKHKEMLESEESFKAAQEEVKRIDAKLKEHQHAQNALEQLKKIDFDKKEINDKRAALITRFAQITNQYNNNTKVSPEEADKLKEKLEAEAERFFRNQLPEIDKIIQTQAKEKCDAAIREYNQYLNKLESDGLLTICGINIPLVESHSFTKNMEIDEKNIHPDDKPSMGFFSKFINKVGKLFGKDWGYTRSKTVDFKAHAVSYIMTIQKEMDQAINDCIRSAEEQVKRERENAERNVKMLNGRINRLKETLQEMTENETVCRQTFEKSKETHQFAQEIKDEIETILEISDGVTAAEEQEEKACSIPVTV